MCRDNDHKGRRCPSDTSEARQLRRKNAGARSSYASQVAEKAEPKYLESAVKSKHTVGSVKGDISKLHELAEKFKKEFHSSDQVFRSYDKRLNSIGAGIEYLAETKYGAPSDEDLRNAREVAAKEASKQADKLAEEGKAHVVTLKAELDQISVNLHEYASKEDYPSIYNRTDAWKEKCPELYKEFNAKQKEIWDTQTKNYKNNINNPKVVIDATRVLLERRNEAMLSALREVGVQFADPESIVHSDDSHADAVKSVKQALAFYPQSWVDASNNENVNNPMRIKRSTGRAHYSTSAEQKGFSHRTRAYIVRMPKDWQPDPHDRRESEHIDLNGADSWTDPASGVVHEDWDTRGGETKGWVHISYDYKQQDTPPKGKMWEKVEFHEEDYIPGEGFVKTGKLVTHYRKPRTNRVQNSSQYKAELTVTKDTTVRVGDNAGMRVAMHEFAHRVEHTTPIITAYEEAFLKRRAGHLSKHGWDTPENPEKLTNIYSGKKEMGFKDNFPSHYMGKVYDTGFREILSMGMESLFTGTNGGLAGIGNETPDPDYKKFILGVLASSVKK